MKHLSNKLTALSVLAGLGISAMPGHFGTGLARAEASAPSAKAKAGETQRSAPGDAKIHRLGTGYARRNRAPVGKRYRASVRQHQRHAAKARRRAASR